MSQKKMKCAHCGEVLIREEVEDREFLELGRSVSGNPVCFECFTVVANARGKVLEKMDGG